MMTKVMGVVTVWLLTIGFAWKMHKNRGKYPCGDPAQHNCVACSERYGCAEL